MSSHDLPTQINTKSSSTASSGYQTGPPVPPFELQTRREKQPVTKKSTWFSKAVKFEGHRPGFAFKLGNKGLGYYGDVGQQRLDTPAPASQLSSVDAVVSVVAAAVDQCISQSKQRKAEERVKPCREIRYRYGNTPEAVRQEIKWRKEIEEKKKKILDMRERDRRLIRAYVRCFEVCNDRRKGKETKQIKRSRFVEQSKTSEKPRKGC